MSEELPVLDYVDPLDFEHTFDAPASAAPQNAKNSAGDRKSRRRDRNQARGKAQPDHVSNAERAQNSVEGITITPELDASVRPQDEDRSIDTAVHSEVPSSGTSGPSPLLMWAIDTYEAVSPAIPPITKAVKTSPLGVPKTLVIAGGLLLGVGVLLTINERNKQR